MTIYVLTEPDTRIGRYIGQAEDPKRRFINHLCMCNLRAKSHKNSWIKSLLKQDRKPGMEILAEVDAENADAVEIAYIAAFRMMGFDLVNGTDGGGGGSPSQETRQKLSEANMGHPVSEETRQRISRALMNPSEETRRKISEANKGKTLPEETRQRISLANKGKNRSEDVKRKQSEARKGISYPQMQGEKHHKAKMTEAKVIKLRRLYTTGEWTYRALGKYFGIVHCTAYKIVKRKLWKHL